MRASLHGQRPKQKVSGCRNSVAVRAAAVFSCFPLLRGHITVYMADGPVETQPPFMMYRQMSLLEAFAASPRPSLRPAMMLGWVLCYMMGRVETAGQCTRSQIVELFSPRARSDMDGCAPGNDRSGMKHARSWNLTRPTAQSTLGELCTEVLMVVEVAVVVVAVP